MVSERRRARMAAPEKVLELPAGLKPPRLNVYWMACLNSGEPVDLAWFVKERDERQARREAWLDARGLVLDGDRLVPRE